MVTALREPVRGSKLEPAGKVRCIMLMRSLVLSIATTLLITSVASADGPPAFVTKWGAQGAGDGQFKSPRGITVSKDGYIYVTEVENNRVQKFTRDGVFITKWGTQGSGDGQLSFPVGLATDLEGNVYVAEHFNHRVQKFTGNGIFITKWGSYTAGGGDTNGKFNKPTGLAVDGNGNVYVADYDGRRTVDQHVDWDRRWRATILPTLWACC
jgi:DNA-binding beta-propeller fold protein YncE